MSNSERNNCEELDSAWKPQREFAGAKEKTAAKASCGTAQAAFDAMDAPARAPTCGSANRRILLRRKLVPQLAFAAVLGLESATGELLTGLQDALSSELLPNLQVLIGGKQRMGDFLLG